MSRVLTAAVPTVVLTIATGVALAAAAGAATERTIHPECVKAGDHAKTVFFRTSDRVKLAGVLLGKGPKGVVLAHQSRGDLCWWLPFARTLARAGYHVLPFDFRGYGESQRVNREDLAADVAAAGQTLRLAGVKTVVYMGASMGGTASLAASARTPAPAGVVSLSGPSVYHNMDAAATVARVDVPLLLMAAKGDRGFSADQKTLYDAASTSDKQVALVAGFDHGVDLLTGRDRVRVKSLISAFLRKHLVQS